MGFGNIDDSGDRSLGYVAHNCYSAAMVVGLVGLSGWVIDERALTALKADYVTMMSVTALSLIVSGWSAIATAGGRNPRIAAISGFLLLSGCAVSVAGQFAGTGLPVFVDETPHMAVAQGVPSWGTMFGFTCCAAVLFGRSAGQNFNRSIGFVCSGLGCVAHVGYMLDLPQLYYFFPGLSTAMAVHTAAGFIFLGMGLLAEHGRSQR